jgi:uncharacterized membrane protein
MSPEAQKVVSEYMNVLKKELRSLPKAQREEILDDIGEHVDQSLGRNGSATEADARTVLDQLGDPTEIARDARERFGIPSSEFGGREILALILLPVGGFFFGVGWFVGVALLWASDLWTKKEKLIGTFVFPGGVAFPVILVGLISIAPGDSEEVCGSAVNQQTGVTHTTCSGGGSDLATFLFPFAMALLTLVAIAVPVWLGMRARKRAAGNSQIASRRTG